MWNEICSKVFSECVETLENKKIEYFTTDYSLKNVASIYTLKLVIDIDIE